MRWVGLVALGGVLVALAGAGAGLRVNTSASMPIGLYRVREDVPIIRGEMVVACPTADAVFIAAERGWIGAGSCPTGLEPLIKTIVAVAGDSIDVTSEGLRVNGRPLADSAQLLTDSAGRAMPSIPLGHYTVPTGAVWLMGQGSRSFDSRYFGAVPVGELIDTAMPLVTL